MAGNGNDRLGAFVAVAFTGFVACWLLDVFIVLGFPIFKTIFLIGLAIYGARTVRDSLSAKS